MKIKVKHIIPIVFGFFLLQNLIAQDDKSMNDNLRQKFLTYTQNVPWEEIYIHFDKEEYVSGEDMWFNVFLIDRQSFRLSDKSRIVYFEILNTENRPLIQKRILVTDGLGPGHITLPDTLSSGTYIIRAYTNWMKNFLPGNCFMKDISVFNTLSVKPFKRKSATGNINMRAAANYSADKLLNRMPLVNVDNSQSDSLLLLFNIDNDILSESNDRVIIFIQTHGNINYTETFIISEGNSRIAISKRLLSMGINHITVFNSEGKPLTERYIYTPSAENGVAEPETPDRIGLREKITVDLKGGLFSSLDPLNMSISVAPYKGNSRTLGLNEYLIFGTEYGSFPENILSNSNLNYLSEGIIDSLLLNIKSNWIDWNNILAENLPVLKYKFEKEEHFLSGRLLRSDDQIPPSGSIVFMCTPGKDPGFQYARTDGEGNFSFSIHIDEELKDLVLIPEDQGAKSKIIIESSFSDQYSDLEISADSALKSIPSYVSKMSVNYQVRKIFGVSAVEEPSGGVLQTLRPLRFYGKPDVELLLADYISLPTMEEVFFELLPHITLKKKNSENEISISDRIDDSPYFTVPFLLLDGVIIRDASVIAALDPEIVEKIDVIKGSYLVGRYIFPGLINVTTRSADFTCIPLPDYMLRLSYRVVEPVNTFVSPDYSSMEKANSRIPDYRNTLYWNPAVRVGIDSNEKVEFWSSDNKSDYVIHINGFTNLGTPFSIKKKIAVK